ncbi:MAG: hypothetical protein A3H96_13065 [Acidobacteria bacterium RIFCSPLOWO2_02_FULL_67_36]|nr:MAG: hypothetical protein A3H96_13065 [Acidobacteria bacterium RIFCSPLOWO2_02_FULL_67_36]OFW23550.1 MAG: hypothetical protein A3G21_06370 [Acidobacteria bacterium RIFCSPLOWO2_12_FULL_66_21]
MRVRLLMLPFMVFALCASHAALASAQDPVPNRVVQYDNYGPPPANLDELWSAAQLVVRGIVEGSQVRRAAPSGPPSVVTDHRVRVLEILKDSLGRKENREVIHVLQSAGSLSIEGKEFTVDPGSMAVLARGQEVLVFLNEWTKGGGFSIAAGPAGVYILDEDVLRLPSFIRPVFGDRRTVAKAEFLAALRYIWSDGHVTQGPSWTVYLYTECGPDLL